MKKAVAVPYLALLPLFFLSLNTEAAVGDG